MDMFGEDMNNSIWDGQSCFINADEGLDDGEIDGELLLTTSPSLFPKQSHDDQQQKNSKARKSRTRAIKKMNIIRVKSKKPQKKTISDYKKNICGYIAKKVLRQFTDPMYKRNIDELCHCDNTTYQSVTNYYEGRIQRITGPSHLPNLFEFTNKEESSNCRVFMKFFKWFLNERYVRHLISEGKMEQKMVYIDYKNRELIPYLHSLEKSLEMEFDVSTLLHHQTEINSVF